ncbi:MAG: hypothetical protein ABSF85_04840 [Terriglobales bacterium]|jgi:hypothetical protein
MNPLAYTKCAGRLLMALAAIASILLLASCGSSSSSGPPAPNNQGFNNSNLKGTYVFSISGTDIRSGNESFFAFVGTIAADGNGNITGGTVDINDANLPSPGVFLAQPVGKTTYSVSSDGRGTAHLPTAYGNFGLDFVLTSSTHGLITRFDPFGSGSGTLDLQVGASPGSLGPLAFSLAGSDPSGNPLGTIGAFTFNTSTGAITSGTEDFNDNGSSTGSTIGPADLVSPSSLVLTSSTNGTAQLDSSFASLGFDVWVIDQNHLKFIETDTTSGYAVSGDAFPQLTSFTPGQLVFTLAGLDSSKGPFVAGGYATAAANGGISNGTEDYNAGGTIGTQTAVAGSCTTFTAGRCQLALTGFSNGAAQLLFQLAAYPSSGGVLLLENDSLGLAQGAAFAQTETSFAASTGYGLNLSGVNENPCLNSAAEVDDIAQFLAGSPDTSSTGPANMSGIVDENDVACQLNFNSGLKGIYIPDSAADGRGSIGVLTSDTLIGGLTLQYYVVDGSTMLFIEVDSNQVAVGTFQAQSATSSAAAAQSRMAIVHPAIRAQGALPSK